MIEDPTEYAKKQPGYQEYRELAARTPTAKFPWGMLLGNVVGIAGAHAAGYYAGGALAHVLANSRIAGPFNRLGPATQRQILAQMVGAAGSIGAVATSLASLAGHMRVAEELSRLERERHQASGQGNEKVAELYETYYTVLERMYG